MGIALRHVVKFPANVLGTRGINLVKQNGQYTFKLDYGALNPTASVDPNSLIAYQNPVTGEMGVTTVTAATNSNLNLLSIANADTDTDKLGYWSGENSYALTDLTSFSSHDTWKLGRDRIQNGAWLGLRVQRARLRDRQCNSPFRRHDGQARQKLIGFDR